MTDPDFRALAQPAQELSQLSDGYHTFAELYEHRHALVLCLMKAKPKCFWFSRRHNDGELCFGGDEWFIVGGTLPGGEPITYHLPARLWKTAQATGAAEQKVGDPWDGHSAADVVQRLLAWAEPPMTDPTNRPLWQVMHDADIAISRETGPIASRRGYAAELRAIADEIPEVLYGAGGVRRWLLEEADRAEAAALMQPATEPPTDEVATLIPWLLEAAVHAADEGEGYAAGKFTLAAQLLSKQPIRTDMTDPTNRLPLWQVMDIAKEQALERDDQCHEAFMYAAELRAIADWLVPEEPMIVEGGRSYEQAWLVSERERLRRLLLDEADRAEAAAVYEQAIERNHMRKNRGTTTNS
jgi:hypothetical protein